MTFLFKLKYLKNIKLWGGMGAAGMYELGISTGYIVLTLCLAMLGRRFLEWASPQPCLAKRLLQEALAAWELCASCFELIIVADNWGVGMYALYLWLLTIWWSWRWGEASACAYAPLEAIIEGGSDLITALASIGAQLAGALAVFGYVELLWSMDFSKTHRGRDTHNCSADLQVPAMWGMIIELVATCMCRVASRLIAEVKPRAATALDSFLATALVVLAFNYSGGYFNPVLATSLKYGCKGHTRLQHLVVYWIGSSVGAILGLYVFRLPGLQATAKKLKGSQD